MSARGGVAIVIATAVASAPAAARAEGGCLDREGGRAVVREAAVFLLNPMGMEHQARLGLCEPLYASRSVALGRNHVELGASSYFSPVYAYVGPYAELAPATFFSVRFELLGLGMWPIPIAGAGYYPLASAGAKFNDADVPEGKGKSAGGWVAKTTFTLLGKVDLGPKAAIVAADQLSIDHEEVGWAPYWLDVRNDLVAARKDEVACNEAAVLFEIPIKKSFLRFGPYDALRATPRSGYVGHQIGGMAMFEVAQPTRSIASFAVWARLGGYTHHAIRAGEPATLLGVAFDWDLDGRL